MRRLWLIFSQAVTVSLAVVFVVTTLKPEWLAGKPVAPVASVVDAPAAPASRDANGVASYAEAARRALPAVVHVYTSKAVRTPRTPWMDDPIFRHFFGDRGDNRPRRASGLGSGVIVSAEGYVLTNNHVVEAADEIEVALNDGRKFPARIVGRDPDTDLAVLQLKAPGRLPAITLASAGTLKVGDVVLAIGNPFGVGQTTTMGIVSALDRTQLGINTFEDFIQTDAAINPGNSGGALIDTRGDLVGINTAIYSRTGSSAGIGFAIPVSLAREVLDQIVANGSVTRGWIGVEMQELTPELIDALNLPAVTGSLVSGVIRGAPAERAGVRPGDVIIGVAGKAVDSQRSVIDLIAHQKPGAQTALKIQRGKEVLALDITIAKRPTPKVAQE